MNPETYLAQLLSLPAVDHALLSPDGRWVAFNWYRIHANMDVFLVPTDGSAPPVALTHTPEFTELESWTSDSRAVIVSEDHDRDEHSRLFRVDIERPGMMQPLTEDRPPYFIRSGYLSPDGGSLCYGANYDFASQQVLEPTWVYRHDLASGQRTALARPAKPAYMAFELNKAGTHLLYTRQDRHPAGRQVHLVDVEGKSDREILNFGDNIKAIARWFPPRQETGQDENILVIAETPELTPYTRLGIYHWPTESMRWILDDPSRSIDGAWVSPDGMVIVNQVEQSCRRPTWIDPDTGIESAFPRLPGNLLPLGRAVDGAWIAVYSSATQPAELMRFTNLESPVDLQSLTRVWEHTSLTPKLLTPAENLTWLSNDGPQIQGWLYRATPNPRRAVIMIHGGPTWHAEDEIKPVIQYLAWQGFNVLDVNYRGSTGFGLAYRDAIKVDGWGGREQEDITSGAQALIDLGLAEPGKVGVFGTSYGGYSSWCQITRHSPHPIAAAAPICGMTDLVIDYETTRPDLRPYSEEMIGGSPAQNPQRYFERSPIHFVENIRGKLLIVQGAVDPNVTPENVRQVIARLEACKIPYELLVFDDEGHGILKPANQQILFSRLAVFFSAALSS
jgi:dipeptidyl aminopeptidase/acylaminoacyl peptidase